MKRSIFILFFCGVALMATAQKIVSVSGEYTYYAPSYMSLDEAKQAAILQTKLHVLEAKFGTLINSTTTLILKNTKGINISSRTDVKTLSIHEVKGEWIEDTRIPEQEVLTDKSMPNELIIHTRVWGKAREIVGNRASIEVSLLRRPYKGAVSETFKSGEDFFLYFKSPTSGFLTVHLLDTDENKAYCLLPNDSRGNVRIENNKENIFFKDTMRYYLPKDSLKSIYEFTTEYPVIYNHISVVFSPNEFHKPNDQQIISSVPGELSLDKYYEWLVRCKARDPQMIDKLITVQIVQ